MERIKKRGSNGNVSSMVFPSPSIKVFPCKSFSVAAMEKASRYLPLIMITPILRFILILKKMSVLGFRGSLVVELAHKGQCRTFSCCKLLSATPKFHSVHKSHPKRQPPRMSS